MIMTALKQEAYQLLNEFDESEMTTIITLLKNYKLRIKESQNVEKGMERLRIIESFAGRLPKDFNEKEELARGLEEKYGNFTSSNGSRNIAPKSSDGTGTGRFCEF